MRLARSFKCAVIKEASFSFSLPATRNSELETGEALKAGAFGRKSQAIYGFARCDEKSRSVFAPRQVACRHAGFDAAQMSAVRRDDIDTSRTGGKQIAVFVDLHAVRNAELSFGPGRGIEENFSIGDFTIRQHVVNHPDGIAGVGVADVELFFVRREG